MDTFLLRILSLLILCYYVTGQHPVPPSFGIESKGALPDSAFTASSQVTNSPASNGRLKRRGANSAWLPRVSDTAPWIQVDLGTVRDVYSVKTQGRQDLNQFTRSYSISSSVDGVTFDFVMEGGANKIYPANINRNSHVRNNIFPALKARYVRLHPTECGPGRQCALRLDIFGYAECNDNFQRFYTNCYLHVEATGSFSEQQAVCQLQGAELASITTEDENNFIADLSGGVRSWIGGQLDQVTGAYLWNDGSDWSLTKWRKREPNNWGGLEFCIETNFVRPGLWNDHFCKKIKPAVCKRATL